ncbi:hypothetical protein SD81_020820 [Tolypothrix campylonemoides VB511288]|nr:hypothetical protein SD81_020820 [Tolypothrix campylonemoides VB511288]
MIRWLPGLEEPITGITEILTDSEGNNVFVAVKDGTTTLIKDIDNTLVDYFTGAPVSGFAVV